MHYESPTPLPWLLKVAIVHACTQTLPKNACTHAHTHSAPFHFPWHGRGIKSKPKEKVKSHICSDLCLTKLKGKNDCGEQYTQWYLNEIIAYFNHSLIIPFCPNCYFSRVVNVCVVKRVAVDKIRLCITQLYNINTYMYSKQLFHHTKSMATCFSVCSVNLLTWIFPLTISSIIVTHNFF